MEGFILSDEELSELHDARLFAKKTKDVNAAYKIHAIILLGTGMSREEVSEVLFISLDTLTNYVKKYKKTGIKQLCKTYYRGRPKKLSEDKIKLLEQELDQNTHLTTRSICKFMEDAFNINYTVSGATDLLRNLGYVYKKPKLVPSNSEPDLQDIFLEQYFEFMRNKKPNEAAFFIDAVHPVHNSMPAYGWIKKGKNKELKSNSGRNRLNIHGAMNAETFETTIISTEGSINSESSIELFQYLEKLYPLASVLYVILDNAKYHYSNRVVEYVKNSRIKLVFLPSYSPELNLIERLWKVFNKNVLYNKFYETFSEFKQSCINFFINQKKYEKEIESIMGDGLSALVS